MGIEVHTKKMAGDKFECEKHFINLHKFNIILCSVFAGGQTNLRETTKCKNLFAYRITLTNTSHKKIHSNVRMKSVRNLLIFPFIKYPEEFYAFENTLNTKSANGKNTIRKNQVEKTYN